MNKYYYLFWMLMSFSLCPVYSQSSLLLNDAEQYLVNENYALAIEKYEELSFIFPSNQTVFIGLIESCIGFGDPEKANTYLDKLLKIQKKESKEYLRLKAKVAHYNLDFSNALTYYKKYYINIPERDILTKQLVKDNIQRCISGQTMHLIPKESVIINNLGTTVNSVFDDFAPLISPNQQSRLYFSSITNDNIGEKSNKNGDFDPIHGMTRADIFTTEKTSGDWDIAKPFSQLINTDNHDILLGFSHEGKKMYTYRSSNLYNGNIYVDTFYQSWEQPTPTLMDSQIENKGSIEKDLFFWSDSLLLFTSDRIDMGFGGFDLYYAYLDSMGWSKPINLGPSINTPYDEVAPFLVTDGHTLYYSSNNTNSIGGFDIFKINFSFENSNWNESTNLGLPINSAGDEMNFKLDKNATIAYYDSNRPGGVGMKDLYTIYFKSSQNTAQNTQLFHTYFKNINTTAVNDTVEKEEKVNLLLKNLFFGDDIHLLSPSTQKYLDKVAQVLSKNPTIKLRIDIHTDNQSEVSFNFINGLNNGKAIKQYLVSKGMSNENIILRSFSDKYPTAKNQELFGRKSNNSISFHVYNPENTGVVVENEELQVSEIFSVSDRKDYYNNESGLTYRLMLKESEELVEFLFIKEKKNLFLEKISNGTAQYMLGATKTYAEALLLKDNFVAKNQNYSGIYINAYIDGNRLSYQDVEGKILKYPDLQNYLK